MKAILVLFLAIPLLLGFCTILLESLTIPESHVSAILFAERRDLKLYENRERMGHCCQDGGVKAMTGVASLAFRT